MEKKKVTVEGPFSLGAFTLIPVSETTCAGKQIGRALLFHATKVPMAVVVMSPTEKKAFRMTGEEISFETLAEEVPEIRRKISGSATEILRLKTAIELPETHILEDF